MDKESYFITYSWMPKLGLRGTALAVYAVIYSFTEQGLTWHGSCSTLAERVEVNRTTVMKALSVLEKRGLIKRVGERRSGSGRAIVEYTALKPEGKCNETQHSMCQNDTFNAAKRNIQCSQTQHNNKINNKDNNKGIYIRAQARRDSFGNERGPRKPYNRALDYKQREYTREDLKRMGISLGEELYEDDD